jgi:FkbM family methyltransferase
VRPPTPSSPVGSAPLQLPGGRLVQVVGNENDITIVEPLRASAGSWEPHVRAVFERLVKPDWVCLDIGANIGAHTLALASLATAGQVIAFEAGRQSFVYLQQNASALSAPKARIVPVHCALWDSSGYVDLAASEELAGGAFAADRSRELSDHEQTLVIAGREIRQRVRIEHVPAVRLDDWIADHPLARLDLVKLDVEGAETRVLSGAAATFARFRPTIVTEYNASAATGYFGEPVDGYFKLLTRSFASLWLIEAEGSLSELSGWDQLESTLSAGKGWEDLLAIP